MLERETESRSWGRRELSSRLRLSGKKEERDIVAFAVECGRSKW
jgi:hypothetical protein